MIADLLAWLTNPEHWRGAGGVPAQTLLHLYYCVVSVGTAMLIAVPLGLYIGHTGRGATAVVAVSNAMRALPTLGLVTMLVLIFGLGDTPALAGLVILAIPAILAGTCAGVDSVPSDIVDAARGMGMTSIQRLWRVELPNALPLLIGGVRSAMLQVVATATVAAYVNLGGLGRILLDGLAVGHYEQMAAAALFIALLAVAVDLVLAGISRLVVPRGLALAAEANRDGS
ncbi:osmoprotectant transport system permease protein [Halopolyspora algeriensis]|uniref:Osmoprotectant transport system permease protein n=1 Tax=Halopolyspora algeriensis TaxID=1500506 RepID=A0A368VU47_9ACTN|nr:ABC transporter permease [Halopolyspora algeriensis]RCW45341.1 osmoprotectant transport system permease protein [Halopolyspora algeriensis]TQM47381.1 osmoprotectant transport system permease protein [Halopolyspora algeriensis]